MNIMKNKVISLLQEVKRDGVENLIQFIKESGYLENAGCNNHHTERYGLMMHSLEVLDSMLGNNTAGLPRDSIIIVALSHDLGMAGLDGETIDYDTHPDRSISILKQCGVELTEDESNAILKHHPKDYDEFFGSLLASPIHTLLQIGNHKSMEINKRGETYRFSSI